MKIVIGAIVGVCSAIIGAVATYFFSKKLIRQTHRNTLEIVQINEYNRAAYEFRAAFDEEIALIQSRTKGSSPDTDEILEAAFQKHLMAVNEFRRFLLSKDISAFNKAWDAYHTVNGEHYLKQYAEEHTGFHNKYAREPHLAAIERIETLLSFAKPK